MLRTAENDLLCRRHMVTCLFEQALAVQVKEATLAGRVVMMITDSAVSNSVRLVAGCLKATTLGWMGRAVLVGSGESPGKRNSHSERETHGFVSCLQGTVRVDQVDDARVGIRHTRFG